MHKELSFVDVVVEFARSLTPTPRVVYCNPSDFVNGGCRGDKVKFLLPSDVGCSKCVTFECGDVTHGPRKVILIPDSSVNPGNLRAA